MTSREKLKELEDSQRNGFMGYNQRMNITNVLSAMWPINWFSIYNYYSDPPAPGKKCNNNWATYNGQRCINARIVELEKIIRERPNWKVFLKEALITALIPLIIFYILGQNFHYIGKVLQNKNISNKMAGTDSTEEPYWPSDPAPTFNDWWHDCNRGEEAGSLTNSKGSPSIVNMPKTDDWNKYGSPFFNNIKYQEFAESCTINNDQSKQNASYVWITHFLLADWWSSYRSFINNYIKITVPGPETNNLFNSICYYFSPLFALLPLIVLSLPWPFILTIKGLLTLISGKLKIWPFTNLKPKKFAEQENDDPEQLGCFERFAKMRDSGCYG